MEKEVLAALIIASIGALGALTTIGLFWNASIRTKGLETRLVRDREETVAAVELLRGAMARMESTLNDHARLIELLPSAVAAMPTALPPLSMNLSKRTQVLRMHKRGDSTELIASSIGVPRREVELLVKVQEAARIGLGATA